MTELSSQSNVGDIASNLPGAAEIFRQNGISFCCGGKLSLAEAAAGQGLDVAPLLDALRALEDGAARTAPEETLPLIDALPDTVKLDIDTATLTIAAWAPGPIRQT